MSFKYLPTKPTFHRKTPVITARLLALMLLAACTFSCGTKADPTINACEEASKSVTEVSNAATLYSQN